MFNRPREVGVTVWGGSTSEVHCNTEWQGGRQDGGRGQQGHKLYLGGDVIFHRMCVSWRKVNILWRKSVSKRTVNDLWKTVKWEGINRGVCRISSQKEKGKALYQWRIFIYFIWYKKPCLLYGWSYTTQLSSGPQNCHLQLHQRWQSSLMIWLLAYVKCFVDILCFYPFWNGQFCFLLCAV